jgi:hypothetical protein
VTLTFTQRKVSCCGSEFAMIHQNEVSVTLCAQQGEFDGGVIVGRREPERSRHEVDAMSHDVARH